MSELITQKVRSFKIGKPTSTLTLWFTDHTVSNCARNSEMTKMSKAAEVSPQVPVGDTTRVINAFSLQFDRHYIELHDKIVNEYADMRTTYMAIY